MIYFILGVVIAIVIGIKLTRGNQPIFAKPHKPLAEAELLRKLTLRASGDKALVERLIAFEQKRQPSATRRSCVIAALERWERDTR